MRSSDTGEAKFDPSVHLQLEPPRQCKTLDFKDVPFPYQPTGEPFPGLAYTTPFRLLSDAGVKAMRAVLESNKEHAKVTPRNTCVRGLGYRSQFIRDFSFCKSVVDTMSALAN